MNGACSKMSSHSMYERPVCLVVNINFRVVAVTEDPRLLSIIAANEFNFHSISSFYGIAFPPPLPSLYSCSHPCPPPGEILSYTQHDCGDCTALYVTVQSHTSLQKSAI